MSEMAIILILLSLVIIPTIFDFIYYDRQINLRIEDGTYNYCLNYVEAMQDKDYKQAQEIEEELRKLLSAKRKVRVKTQHGFSQRGFHPGVYIQEIIEDLEMTQGEYAKELRITKKELEQIISGETEINERIALMLSEATGVGSQTWLNIQKEYNNYQKENK